MQSTSILYAPGTSAFVRLVSKTVSKQLHNVKDIDENIEEITEKLIRNWTNEFGANFKKMHIAKVLRGFNGTAVVKVRCVVAHDSYERLINIECSADNYTEKMGRDGLEPISEFIDTPESVGLMTDQMTEKAMLDVGVSEFYRFYKERMVQEVAAAGNDIRKKKKLEDEFTPRIEMSLVGLQGDVHRQLQVEVTYELEEKTEEYTSKISIIPSDEKIIQFPIMDKCESTDRTIPKDCLSKCEISGRKVIRHLLVISELSGRKALPEYIVTCSLSGKRVLTDEVEKSAISGDLVSISLLKTSQLSGKHAEPKFFGRCEFTSAEVLESELAVSQVSGKKYRIDEQLQSVVSGETGHKQEFIFCSETHEPILKEEAEVCEVTKKVVLPGVLEVCEVTKKHVLPSKLEKSAVSGKKALKKYFVSSSISNARLLESESIKSIKGNYCSPLEAKNCNWSNKNLHPEDLKICSLTELPVYIGYLSGKPLKLEALNNLLQGLKRTTEAEDEWDIISTQAAEILHNKNCIVEYSILSPDKKKIAACIEIKTLFGFKTRYAGSLYSIEDKNIVGKIALGKVDEKWIFEESF